MAYGNPIPRLSEPVTGITSAEPREVVGLQGDPRYRFVGADRVDLSSVAVGVQKGH